jgi:oxalate---CoA ligase
MQQTGNRIDKEDHARCTNEVFRRVEQHLSQPFLLEKGRDSLSRKEFQTFMETIKGMLRNRGIGRSDRVAIVLPNGPEMAAAFLSVSAVATCAPLNPAYQAPEFEFYLRDLAARAVIVDAKLDSPVREVAASLEIPILELIASDRVSGIFQLEGSEAGSVNQDDWSGPTDTAMILHTSGTTSRPKMVPLSHQNVWTSAHNVAKTLRLTPDDRCLNVMPLFHIHGLIAALAASSIAGASIVCTSGFQKDRFLDWLKEFHPTWYTAVPTIHQAVLQLAEKNPEKVRNAGLHFIRSSSASLPPAMMQKLESLFGVPVVEAYGMTEAAHQICCNPLPNQKRKAGTVGPAAGPEVAIMDEDGNLLSPKETGEVVIRGKNVTAGYESNPEANKVAFQTGWFRTGDQGFMDNDGYLTLTGRLKEIINRGGENIAPREIDEVLLGHPAVEQAVAFAIPHSSYGETVAAAVVLKPGMFVSESELRRFAASRLAEFKVPHRIVKVAAIPKGPTGKLQRIGLYEKLSSMLEVTYTPPATANQQMLISIFETVLEKSGIGIHDHFFDLGGDSLAAGRVITRIERELKTTLPIATLFLAPTVAELADEVTKIREQENLELEKMVDELETLTDEEVRQALKNRDSK